MNNRKIYYKLVNSIILTIIVVFLSGLIYSIIHYDNVINLRMKIINSPFDGVLLCYILPIAIIIFCSVSLKLSINIRMNVAVVFCSIIFSLYFVEGTARIYRIFYPLKDQMKMPLLIKKRAIAEKMKLPFDTRKKIDVVQKLRKDGINAFPIVYPMHFLKSKNHVSKLSLSNINGNEVFPLSSISNVTTVFCNESGEWIIYDSDEYGFHNPKGLYKSGDLDIAVIGDSYTHGSCVCSEDNLVGFIRDVYKKTLNFGFGGNGPLLELGTFREYVEPLRPKIVIWYYTMNDMKDLKKEKNDGILIKYIDSSYRQNLQSVQSEIDRALVHTMNNLVDKEMERKKIFYGFFSLIHCRNFIKRIIIHKQIPEKQIHSNDRSPKNYYDFDLFNRILKLVKDTVDSWNGTFYFMCSDKKVLSNVESLDILTIDINKSALRRNDPSMYPFNVCGGHYGKVGYRILADLVLQRIKSDGYSGVLTHE